VILDAPLSGDAARDGRAVYDAIRKGSVFTAIDALAAPGFLDVRVQGTTVVARATRPRGAELALISRGAMVAYSSADVRYDAVDKPGAYRVEVRIPNAPGNPPIPWLVSNFVLAKSGAPSTPSTSSTSSTAPPAPDRTSAPAALGAIPPFPWRIEKDPASSAILRSTDRSADLEYTLAAGGRNGQFVALATDVRGDSFSVMRFGLKPDRPSRVWIQARAADGRRWGRSFYVDQAGSEIVARLADLRPMAGEGARVDRAAVTSVLLVVDLTNAVPGKAGRLTVLSSELVK
jgi:hypothetical protein